MKIRIDNERGHFVIHNHEVEGSIPSLATTESPGTKCQGFSVSGWIRKSVSGRQKETENPEQR